MKPIHILVEVCPTFDNGSLVVTLAIFEQVLYSVQQLSIVCQHCQFDFEKAEAMYHDQYEKCFSRWHN